jgi:hypothetical protein
LAALHQRAAPGFALMQIIGETTACRLPLPVDLGWIAEATQVVDYRRNGGDRECGDGIVRSAPRKELAVSSSFNQ